MNGWAAFARRSAMTRTGTPARNFAISASASRLSSMNQKAWRSHHLVPNQMQQRRTAILGGRIAEPFGKRTFSLTTRCGGTDA